MIVSGLLLLAWGVAVLAVARPLHLHWRKMLGQIRASGIVDSIPGTRFFASRGGLRSMQIAGAVGVAVGLALLVAGGLGLLPAPGQP